MSAEALGNELLSEVKEESLDKVGHLLLCFHFVVREESLTKTSYCIRFGTQ